MQKQSRPRGVSIIAILIIIAGVLSLLLGIGLVVIGPFFMNGLQTTSSNLGSQMGSPILGLVFLVIWWHIVRTWCCKSCYGVWIVERQGMGLDYIYNSIVYWNCHKHTLCFDNGSIFQHGTEPFRRYCKWYC